MAATRNQLSEIIRVNVLQFRTLYFIPFFGLNFAFYAVHCYEMAHGADPDQTALSGAV